ncbi:hypothetical protein KRMM14A1259_63560 [Krasilnikovia sp. MM14-A1259]
MPATEYTSLTPGSSASAWATSGMESVAQSMCTIAVFTCGAPRSKLAESDGLMLAATAHTHAAAPAS